MGKRLKSRRLEEKRRRREKRLTKRYSDDELGLEDEIVDDLERIFEAFLPAPASHWPGGVDSTVARPDLVKYAFGRFVTRRQPWRSAMREFEDLVENGPLGDLPEIRHWAMEEFLYHGSPGGRPSPLEDFLSTNDPPLSTAAKEQILRWREARLGAFEVGSVERDTVCLRPWDLRRNSAVGETIRAVALSIGGVNVFNGLRGKINVTYVAPWAPEEGIWCCMGYGIAVPKEAALPLILLYGLRSPELAARPFPWKEGFWSERGYRSRWMLRDWDSWLRERLQFPFEALIRDVPNGGLRLSTVTKLIDLPAAETRRFGIYFECPGGRAIDAAGATGVVPVDLASPNVVPLAEYRAYRDIVGPPVESEELAAYLSGRGGRT